VKRLLGAEGRGHELVLEPSDDGASVCSSINGMESNGISKRTKIQEPLNDLAIPIRPSGYVAHVLSSVYAATPSPRRFSLFQFL